MRLGYSVFIRSMASWRSLFSTSSTGMPSTPTLPTACVGGAVSLSEHSAQGFAVQIVWLLAEPQVLMVDRAAGTCHGEWACTQHVSLPSCLSGQIVLLWADLLWSVVEQELLKQLCCVYLMRSKQATPLWVPWGQQAGDSAVCTLPQHWGSKQVTVLCVPYHSIAAPCETVWDELQASFHHSLCCCMPHLHQVAGGTLME